MNSRARYRVCLTLALCTSACGTRDTAPAPAVVAPAAPAASLPDAAPSATPVIDAAPAEPDAGLSGAALGAALDAAFDDLDAARKQRASTVSQLAHAESSGSADAKRLAGELAALDNRIEELERHKERLLARAAETDLLSVRAVMVDGQATEAWWEQEPPCPDGSELKGAPPPKKHRIYCRHEGGYNAVETTFHETGYKDSHVPRNARGEHGTVTYWYRSGVKRFELEYASGLRHGASRSYYDNGQLSATGAYHRDQMHGTWVLYDRSGKQIFSSKLNKGSGAFWILREDGTVWKKGTLRNGEPRGTWLVYDEHGTLVEKHVHGPGNDVKRVKVSPGSRSGAADDPRPR